MPDRVQIRRWLGHGSFPGPYDMADRWTVTTYIHVGVDKYPVEAKGGLCCFRIAEWHICAGTLEELRERAIDVRRSRSKAND